MWTSAEGRIIESEEYIKSGKLMRERRIFNELRDFREDLESSGTAPMSVKARLTGVRSFFNFYNFSKFNVQVLMFSLLLRNDSNIISRGFVAKNSYWGK